MFKSENLDNLSLQGTSYRKKRYYIYAIVTTISLILPFIKINDNHIFLLSFDKKQLHLMGVVFDMQELYLMPFLLILLFLGIFVVTSIWGRVWCGWACPQTIFRVIYRDLIESTLLCLRRIKNKQKGPDYSKNGNKIKKILGIILWSILALIAASNFMWYFVPPEDFFEYIKNPADHMVLMGFVIGITIFLIYDVVSLKEDFCVYICPYSRVQSVLYDNNTLRSIYSTLRGGNIYDEQKNKIVFKEKDLAPLNECTTCQSCVNVCPTHIDIRKGLQLECINCLECVDACSSVMGKLGKESLVQWSSTNKVFNNSKTKFIRKSIIMYFIALILVVGLLIIMGGEKENMLLNINKTTQLYKIKEDNKVSNNFLFLFQNTDTKEHQYAIEVVDNPDIYIEKFKPFTLGVKKLSKKVVVLSTNKILANNKNKDTPITVKIKAYAVDDPNRVVVYRDAVFIYPRLDKLK